jgi:tetraprenyl-beta-curcumene synthase
MRELAMLAYVMARYWIVVFPLVRAQLRTWQTVAAGIPDPELRAQALETLSSERLSAAGAALFAATTRRIDPSLVRALVAFQVICDYLDTLAEQPAVDPIANGALLHRALPDALNRGPQHDDYYRLHRAREDGGYLVALVDACRESCAALPAFERVREAAVREARRNEVQGMNHAPASEREPALRRWATSQDRGEAEVAWFELAAAGSSSLAVLALLAAAADDTMSVDRAEQIRLAYFPWIEALSTLLDSFVDQERDACTGEMSFVGHYASPEAAVERLGEVAARALAGARALPHGERHVIVVAGMIAMHLSDSRAAMPGLEPATRAVLRAADTAATSVLLAMLRMWRRARLARARSLPAQPPMHTEQPLFSSE